MIRAEGIGKTYPRGSGQVRALDDVSFDVEAGRCLVVVGRSGSGKSTLLNILGTLTRPSTGRVFLDGTEIGALSRAERVRLRRDKIGFVFQSFHLMAYLTAEENVRAGLALRGVPSGAAEARALLERVGLAERAGHFPDQLSVGEKQRVAVARALAGNPSIVLADEPTGNLDPDSAQEVVGYLSGCREQGAAVVVVTHDPRLEEIADRTLRLEGPVSGGGDS